MPYVNAITVDVLATSAEQLRHVLTQLERGEPIDMAKLEASAVNLFTIVGMLQSLMGDSPTQLLQRSGPPEAEEELCDGFLRSASEELPAGRPHIVLLGSKLGRPPYAVSNVSPFEALELLERLQVKITVHAHVPRRVVES